MNKNTFVAFLRGVMPSGRNAVKMADVRAVLSDHGFNDVRTWIQSGNIILNTSLTAEAAAEHIHHLLKTALQVDLPVIIKTQTQLREALEGNPFTGAAFDIRRVFFALCNQPLSDTAGLQQLDLGSECLCIRPHCAYMYIPGSAARSRLGNVFLEKKLGLTLTTRNANTLQKMASF